MVRPCWGWRGGGTGHGSDRGDLAMVAPFDLQRTWGPEPRYPLVMSVPKQERDLCVIAGPCSIESKEHVEVIAKELSRVGVTYMRGGVYRAGTYPPATFGLQ